MSLRRKFGSKTYYYAGQSSYKYDAERTAKRKREQGMLARIVKTDDGYEIWVRNK